MSNKLPNEQKLAMNWKQIKINKIKDPYLCEWQLLGIGSTFAHTLFNDPPDRKILVNIFLILFFLVYCLLYTYIANRWWATHFGVLQSSISSDDKCEWTRCNKSSKHSAASPRQPNGNRRPANGPLANALRNGSGHNAGSELVCNCWNNSWEKRTKITLNSKMFAIFS